MKGVLLASLMVVLAAAGLWAFAPGWLPGNSPVRVAQPQRPGPAAPAGAPATATLVPQPPAALAPEPPRFDVARVGARGMLVTAGRAAPGSEVTLLDSGREIGRARADARGEWVILPPDPMPPGMRELSLSARSAGGESVASRETVLLVVPEPAIAQAAPVAAPAAQPQRQPGPLPATTPNQAASPAATTQLPVAQAAAGQAPTGPTPNGQPPAAAASTARAATAAAQAPTSQTPPRGRRRAGVAAAGKPGGR